jgi:hypothetical protein
MLFWLPRLRTNLAVGTTTTVASIWTRTETTTKSTVDGQRAAAGSRAMAVLTASARSV